MKSQIKSIKRKNRTHKKIRASGCMVEYMNNKSNDKIMLDYVLNEPHSSLLILFPSIIMNSSLRNKLYDYIHNYGHIKAIKKVKMDFDTVVKLLHHFEINKLHKMKLDDIKRSVMLDMSWNQTDEKKIYIIIWKKRSRTQIKKFEKKINDFLIQHEFQNIISSSSFKDSSYTKSLSIDNFCKNSITKNSCQSGGGIIEINKSEFPLKTESQTEEENTLNFLGNIVSDKIYIKLTYDYYETTHFAKILFSNDIIKHL